MTVCRARLSCLSPPRLSRCRVVCPLEAGTGATPARRAKAASERTRPWCDQETINCAAASKQKQPQRLAFLPRSRQRRSLAGERRAGRADSVERVVLTLQPPLVAWAAASLEHRLAAAAQMTSKPGSVMACTLDGPHASAICSGLSEAQRLRVPACVRTHRSSRDNDTVTGNDNREHVLIAMRINSDHVVHFICKHLD